MNKIEVSWVFKKLVDPNDAESKVIFAQGSVGRLLKLLHRRVITDLVYFDLQKYSNYTFLIAMLFHDPECAKTLLLATYNTFLEN